MKSLSCLMVTELLQKSRATQTAMSVALTGITVTDKIEVRGELGYITPYVEVTVGGTRHRIGGNPDDLITGSAGTASRIITGVSVVFYKCGNW